MIKCQPNPGNVGRRESQVWPVAGVRAPAVGRTVAGRHIMPAAEMTACAVGERVGSAPLTSVNRLFRYPDFTW